MSDKLDFFEKADVNGPHTRQPYVAVKETVTGEIPWNFAKYLVDKKGVPYKRYDRTKPLDMVGDIEELLAQEA